MEPIDIITNAIIDDDIYMIDFYTSNDRILIIKNEKYFELSVETDNGDYQFYSIKVKTIENLIVKIYDIIDKYYIVYIKLNGKSVVYKNPTC